jgi:hypothetical protein
LFRTIAIRTRDGLLAKISKTNNPDEKRFYEGRATVLTELIDAKLTRYLSAVGVTEEQFQTLRGLLALERQESFRTWAATDDLELKDKKSKLVDEYDNLNAQFDRILVADTSQDATLDEDDDVNDDA